MEDDKKHVVAQYACNYDGSEAQLEYIEYFADKEKAKTHFNRIGNIAPYLDDSFGLTHYATYLWYDHPTDIGADEMDTTIADDKEINRIYPVFDYEE